jgi:RNA polymerase sigma-70 factor (ECF subfamily)
VVNPVESLWETYSCRLLAYIRSRVPNEADAEDLLQEVFLRVHRHLCCNPDWERPEAWFYRITRNLIVDYYRQREWSEIPEDYPGPDDTALDALQEDPEAQLALSLKETVQALPEPYRQALVLTEYEGLSQKRLAERLGISFSGAKSRVQRARRKLRDLLLKCCHFELDRRGRILDYYPHCCGCNPSMNCGGGSGPNFEQQQN